MPFGAQHNTDETRTELVGLYWSKEEYKTVELGISASKRLTKQKIFNRGYGFSNKPQEEQWCPFAALQLVILLRLSHAHVSSGYSLLFDVGIHC